MEPKVIQGRIFRKFFFKWLFRLSYIFRELLFSNYNMKSFIYIMYLLYNVFYFINIVQS